MTISGQRTLNIAIGAVIVILLIGYGLFQARHMIIGPVVSIEYPQNGATVRTSLVNVEGITSNITAIKLNDRTIYINEEGQFEEPVVLGEGYNVITIEATDRFGRTTKDAVKVMHAPLAKSGPNRLSQEEDHSDDTANES